MLRDADRIHSPDQLGGARGMGEMVPLLPDYGGHSQIAARPARVVRPLTNDGCEIATSCFACPLVRCKYDYATSGGDATHWRDQALLELLAAGMSADEAAAAVGTSRRTVFRAKARRRATGVRPQECP